MMNYENEQTIQTEDSMEKYFFRASTVDFKKIPGYPIAYWLSGNAISSFSGTPIGDLLTFKQGIATSDNERFLRVWSEVNYANIDFSCKSPENLRNSSKKWFPYNKGGSFRKWYGNNELLVNWENDGREMKEFTATLPQGTHVRLKSRDYYCRPCITYSALSSGDFGCRVSNSGFLFDTKGSCIFGSYHELMTYAGLLNSAPAKLFLNVLCPTLDYSMVGIKQVPVLLNKSLENISIVEQCIALSNNDWDSYETSWDFNRLAVLECNTSTIESAYQTIRKRWQSSTLNMQHLEKKNNQSMIEAYGLQNELSADASLNEITLTCNPHYRYGGERTEEELEALLLADTMRELLSYAVGCMFGRYSLDGPGLVLANQGETLADYLAQIPNPTFTPDKDNVIPILDGDWFADDITERFRQFLRITFGDEHYDENLAFIEDSIGKDIRKFFLRDFYNDHIKRYKKRPIYWLFSSPKGTFNALVYLHRYRPDTVSVVLGYLRDFRNKLDAHLKHLEQVSISTDASQAEKTRALKEIDNLKKQLLELDDYEHDTLYPLATQQIAIDLDDGVKANYPKFGSALKKIVGLDAKDDD